MNLRDLIFIKRKLKGGGPVLPDGYTKIKGIVCNNTCYYDTGLKAKGSDTIRTSFSVTGACNVWGAYQSTSAENNYDLYAATASGQKYLRYGDGTYPSSFGGNLNKRFDTVITPTGTHGMPVDSEWEQLEFESTRNFLIGSTSSTSTSPKMRGTFFGKFIIEDANGYRFFGIPCVRESDEIVGYYDTVTESFFEPVGDNPTPLT